MLASHFISDQYGASFFIPGYRRWALDQDMGAAYQWHYHFLQHLQVDYMKERWVLKTPPHLAYLDSIVNQYPDAAIVQTHRAPMDVMGSTASLACTLHSAFSDDIDPIAVGLSEVEYFAEMIKRGMAQREAMPDRESRFFDVQFSDIIRDPIAEIEKIYRHFDFEFTDIARSAMQHYLDNRPREKHGKHHYTLEQFGLNRDKHGPLFSDYCQRFGLKD
ncbi:sulfotransferase [Oceanicoccus sp. KOV_DT_Chl]|uniref:sulfotransferase family protein n=1 Tax=Oceanicoccus sp. KOV_DT_Chl TaxID=1904639 RepID=UPI000C7D6889|nr:sulfotransferase [Oceanicoccus sp. KOV_DT_Chl]